MKLAIDESLQIDVDPAERYQITHIQVQTGERYAFSASGQWRDHKQVCGPEGWRNWWTAYVLRFSRLHGYDLFYLTGNVDQDESSNFPIGPAATVTMKSSGSLFLFANDLWHFYWNNHRITEHPMRVNVCRVA